MIIGNVGTVGSPNSFSQGGTYTLIDSSLHGSVSTGDEFQTVSSKQTGTSVGFTWSNTLGWVTIADAIVRG
jgi:hypothetical protein